MEESQQVYIWCSMRFHKYVSACISVYYVFLVQYALDPGFTRPPRTHFRWTGPQFYTTAPSFSLLPRFTLLATAIAVGPFHYNSALSSSKGPRKLL